MTVISLLTLVIGLFLGTVMGFLAARSRDAAARADLAARVSAADERARAAEQRTALVDGQLAERFQALSAQALDASARRFLEMAEVRLGAANAKSAGELETRRAAVESLVGPLKETLARVEAQLRDSDANLARSHAALAEQVTIARRSSDELKAQTQALVTALRRPEARGRWGEMQLRRVVELAGMSSRCDFDEQVSVLTADGTVRPDMVVHLAGGKHIVVDSKVSLAAYLEAAETADDAIRDARLGAHARHLREHVDRLGAKAYWAAFSPSPEFVVLFIPGEVFLAPALERDPGLLEYAVAHRVHIATPTTLVSLLRTAQYAWQQEALSENARAVFDVGRELYERLSGLGQHVDRLGKTLTGAVAAYNQTVGSLESRVLVSARKLHQMGIVDTGQDSPRLIEETARALSAPELTALAAPESEATAQPGAQAAAVAANPVAPAVTAGPIDPAAAADPVDAAIAADCAEAAPGRSDPIPALFEAAPQQPPPATGPMREPAPQATSGPAPQPSPKPRAANGATHAELARPGPGTAAPSAGSTEEPPPEQPGTGADRGMTPPELVVTNAHGAAG